MTWEELSRSYESDRTRRRKSATAVKSRGWRNIMDSTDKLVWLFLVSGNGRSGTVKTG